MQRPQQYSRILIYIQSKSKETEIHNKQLLKTSLEKTVNSDYR